jgi:hypothetical protein
MTIQYRHRRSGHATSNPTWQADVAKLWRNQIVVMQNQPGPFQWSTWAEPINTSIVCLDLTLFRSICLFGLSLFRASFWSICLAFSIHVLLGPRQFTARFCLFPLISDILFQNVTGPWPI